MTFKPGLLLLEPLVIPTTKQNKLNNADKKLDFSTGRVFVQCDKFEKYTAFPILIKYILNSSI